MDEIGILIKNISDDGHIIISPVGGIEPVILLGESVNIKAKKGFINGVITTKEIHNGDEIKEIPMLKDLYIDTGLPKKELIERGVEIGDYLHLARKSMSLGNDRIISGKALDDRIGCYVLLELAKLLQKARCDIFYVFTVQEELGLYGSQTSIYSIDPDWALVIDTTNADDGVEKGTRQLGQGPCITIKDADIIGNKCLNDLFREKARKEKIPIQLEITDFGTTDALSISVAKGGIPTSMISIPVRNIHTTAGIAHLDDIENAITIISAVLKDPPHKCTT